MHQQMFLTSTAAGSRAEAAYRLPTAISADPGMGGGGFFSTHGVLRGDQDDDVPFTIELKEMDSTNRKIYLTMYPFHDVEMLKRLLVTTLKLSNRITDILVFYKGVELPNRRLLSSFGAVEESTIRLTWRLRARLPCTLRDIRPAYIRLTSKHRQLIQEVRNALQKNINPKLTLEGTGATYQLFNQRGKPIAMFKPRDEEAFAPFNPRGYRGRIGQKGFREGVVSGEGSIREVVAYLLDAFYSAFSGVPMTIPVEMVHPHFCYSVEDPVESRREEAFMPRVGSVSGFIASVAATSSLSKTLSVDRMIDWKSGSLQEFVKARDTSGDYDSRVFCVGDVHRIGILDLRLVNLDRNDGNILVVKSEDATGMSGNSSNVAHLLNTPFMRDHPEYVKRALLTPDGTLAKYRLIPIDHGLTLPHCLDVTEWDLCWMNWPHSHLPFLEDELKYISNLEPDTDCAWIERKFEIRKECLRVVQISTRLLKYGAAGGLYLAEIAEMLVRSGDGSSRSNHSIAERLIKSALTQACYAADALALVHNPGLQLASSHAIMDLASTAHDHPRRMMVPFTTAAYLPQRSNTTVKGGGGVSPTGATTSILSNTTSHEDDEDDADDMFDEKRHQHKLVSSKSELKRTNRVDKTNSLTDSDPHPPPRDTCSDTHSKTSRHAGPDYYSKHHDTRTNGSAARFRRPKQSYTALRTYELMKRNTTNPLWTINDAFGKPIPINWDDPDFIRLFFGAFEAMAKQFIAEKLKSRQRKNNSNKPDNSSSATVR